MQSSSRKWVHGLSLTLMLSAVWLAWSGHTEPLLLGLGAASIATVVFLSARMGLLDAEGNLLFLLPRFPRLGFWLMKEIFFSNLKVCQRILHPKRPLQPKMITIPTSQETDLARTFYANCITLTPGTVCVWVEGRNFRVHALSKRSAKWLEGGEMDRRVSRAIEGAS